MDKMPAWIQAAVRRESRRQGAWELIGEVSFLLLVMFAWLGCAVLMFIGYLSWFGNTIPKIGSVLVLVGAAGIIVVVVALSRRFKR